MRYQSTPEKEFDGDIIITDPCYIIRCDFGSYPKGTVR